MANSYAYDYSRRATVPKPARPPGHDWTSAEDTFIIGLWQSGHSASEIAVLVTEWSKTTRTRNSVIGRIHRLHVKGGKPRPPTKPRAKVVDLAAAREAKREARRLQARKAVKEIWSDPKRAAKQRAAISAGLHASDKFAEAVFNRRWKRASDSGNAGPMRPEPWHPLRDAKPEWLRRS